ncbi:hypothetical protein ACWGB8_29875 [Kitasatospora sp. NPDC054939]
MSAEHRPSGGHRDETILQDPRLLEECPLFALLAHAWSSAGRTVPGQADPEWQRLAAPPVFRPYPDGTAPGPPPPAGPDGRSAAPPAHHRPGRAARRTVIVGGRP